MRAIHITFLENGGIIGLFTLTFLCHESKFNFFFFHIGDFSGRKLFDERINMAMTPGLPMVW